LAVIYAASALTNGPKKKKKKNNERQPGPKVIDKTEMNGTTFPLDLGKTRSEA